MSTDLLCLQTKISPKLIAPFHLISKNLKGESVSHLLSRKRKETPRKVKDRITKPAGRKCHHTSTFAAVVLIISLCTSVFYAFSTLIWSFQQLGLMMHFF